MIYSSLFGLILFGISAYFKKNLYPLVFYSLMTLWAFLSLHLNIESIFADSWGLVTMLLFALSPFTHSLGSLIFSPFNLKGFLASDIIESKISLYFRFIFFSYLLSIPVLYSITALIVFDFNHPYSEQFFLFSSGTIFSIFWYYIAPIDMKFLYANFYIPYIQKYFKEERDKKYKELMSSTESNPNKFIEKSSNEIKIGKTEAYLIRGCIYFDLGAFKKAEEDFNYLVKHLLEKKDLTIEERKMLLSSFERKKKIAIYGENCTQAIIYRDKYVEQYKLLYNQKPNPTSNFSSVDFIDDICNPKFELKIANFRGYFRI